MYRVEVDWLILLWGPTELADYFEEWFTTPACDGFVIAGTHMPGAFEDLSSLSFRNFNGEDSSNGIC